MSARPSRVMFRALAWLTLAAVLTFTLSPVELRPATLAPADVERFAVFALLGGLFCLAYPKHWLTITMFMVPAAGLLELAQQLAPSRHPQLHDAMEQAA